MVLKLVFLIFNNFQKSFLGFIALYIAYILVVVISRIVYNRYKEKNAPKIPGEYIEWFILTTKKNKSFFVCVCG